MRIGILAGENIADNYMAIGLVAEGTLPGSFKITLAKKMLLNTLLWIFSACVLY